MAMPEQTTPELIPLWLADAGADDAALASEIARRWQFTLTEAAPAGLALRVHNNQLQLIDCANLKQQGVVVDFCAGALTYRRQHGGGKKEPIAKAVGVKGNVRPRVVDATPGLGRDAFVLASLGCEVILIERSPVVAALLEDGMRRLTHSDTELAARFSLVHGNSAQVLASWSDAPVDVVYLDPMFPHRKKSAAVKKEMKVFQALLGSDPDADALLAPAKALAARRVVVKRPNSAPNLADSPPSMAITSKKHRFDVYLK